MDIDTVLTQFHFIRPYWLLLIIPFAWQLVAHLGNRVAVKHRKMVLPKHLEKALRIGDASWRKRLPLLFWGFGFCIAIIIAAGPTWQRQASPFGEDNAPLVILLDVSESMLQTDVQPSRLGRAKQKISDLLAIRDGGNTALIVYSGSAHIAMPLTKDNAVFLPLLEAITPKIMPRKGKFAEHGLAEIDKLFTQGDFATQPVTVLWITDGIGTGSEKAFIDYFNRPKELAELGSQQEGNYANDHTLQLIVLGSGDNKREADIEFQGEELDSLASHLGGVYQQISVDNSDVGSINRLIERNVIINSNSAEPWQEMSYPLVFILVAVFLLWFRKGWTVQWCFVGMLMFTAPGQSAAASDSANTVETAEMDAPMAEKQNLQQIKLTVSQFWFDAWLTPDQQGQRYFKKREYRKAAQSFTQPYSKATAFYLAEEFKSAYIYFIRVDSAEALFGAANALAQQREYIAARQLYQQVVQQYPAFKPAQTNLRKIQKIIDDINRQSESQANTEDETSTELGDEPQTGEGADEKISAQMLIKQTYTAEQLLADDALTQAWMKRVEGSPSRFLATKFRTQLNQRQQLTSN
ncbi:vWA domain-containing protein [Shewanella kaireitica]|uniref:vWA domain-containing protein n=1 Tax=Shewanella kaireitica TaxID=212021 RepID=UPI00200F2A13|nr:VWA domain-containing protein [Shewanella kaireitica]MCL1095188.1 VWA domain-containing protein [Shewanella kaireitica]